MPYFVVSGTNGIATNTEVYAHPDKPQVLGTFELRNNKWVCIWKDRSGTGCTNTYRTEDILNELWPSGKRHK